MTISRHPVTGVEINDIMRRDGKLSDDEKRTGRLLIAEGDPRWLAGAKLGVHMLRIPGGGKPASERRRPAGRNLSIAEARRDSRQTAMFDALTESEPAMKTAPKEES